MVFPAPRKIGETLMNQEKTPSPIQDPYKMAGISKAVNLFTAKHISGTADFIEEAKMPGAVLAYF